MSDAILSYGTKFQRKDALDAYVDVAEVTSIAPPQKSRETVDVTHLASPDGYKEFRAGMKDGGEVTIEGHYVNGDAGQGDLRDDFEAGEPHDYRIAFPDGSTLDFAGFPTADGFTIGGPDDPINFSVTLKVTGKPELTEGA